MRFGKRKFRISDACETDQNNFARWQRELLWSVLSLHKHQVAHLAVRLTIYRGA